MTRKEKDVIKEVLHATQTHRKLVKRLMRKGHTKDDVLLGMAISIDKLQSVVDGKPLWNAIAC